MSKAKASSGSNATQGDAKAGYAEWLRFRAMVDRLRGEGGLSWTQVSKAAGADSPGWAESAYNHRSILKPALFKAVEEAVAELPEPEAPGRSATGPDAKERRNRVRSVIDQMTGAPYCLTPEQVGQRLGLKPGEVSDFVYGTNGARTPGPNEVTKIENKWGELLEDPEFWNELAETEARKDIEALDHVLRKDLGLSWNEVAERQTAYSSSASLRNSFYSVVNGKQSALTSNVLDALTEAADWKPTPEPRVVQSSTYEAPAEVEITPDAAEVESRDEHEKKIERAIIGAGGAGAGDAVREVLEERAERERRAKQSTTKPKTYQDHLDAAVEHLGMAALHLDEATGLAKATFITEGLATGRQKIAAVIAYLAGDDATV